MALPDYVGATAFGLKMGVILPGSDLPEMIMERLDEVSRDGLLDDRDVLCVTESLVARTQNNYVTLEETAAEIRACLDLEEGGHVGVLFPIASRNRFSLILKGMARAVRGGKVTVQLSYPRDEVGNQIMSEDLAARVSERHGGHLESKGAEGSGFAHPLTGIDYVLLYKQCISSEGASPAICFCNDPLRILEYRPDAVIVSDIHTREKHLKALRPRMPNVCTLQDFFDRDRGSGLAWSEFGLLGSNMSSGDRLKLAPRGADAFAVALQAAVRKRLGKQVEVIVNGDGAYKDPTSSIYELADPYPALGATPGVKGAFREGVKYKYLVDLHHDQGLSRENIEAALAQAMAEKKDRHDDRCEGTTPRRMEDVLASLADLVSGSADAGTPVVLIKGIFR